VALLWKVIMQLQDHHITPSLLHKIEIRVHYLHLVKIGNVKPRFHQVMVKPRPEKVTVP